MWWNVSEFLFFPRLENASLCMCKPHWIDWFLLGQSLGCFLLTCLVVDPAGAWPDHMVMGFYLRAAQRLRCCTFSPANTVILISPQCCANTGISYFLCFFFVVINIFKIMAILTRVKVLCILIHTDQVTRLIHLLFLLASFFQRLKFRKPSLNPRMDQMPPCESPQGPLPSFLLCMCVTSSLIVDLQFLSVSP